MEVNENTVPQNGKVEDEYVRIGTTLFRILNQPMMNDSFRKMRVEWKMSTAAVCRLGGVKPGGLRLISGYVAGGYLSARTVRAGHFRVDRDSPTG